MTPEPHSPPEPRHSPLPPPPPSPNPPDLPEAFLRRNDAAWVATLPGLLERLGQRWSLTLQPPFSRLSYNYVAPAMREGGACVLKLCDPARDSEFLTETEALRLWDGRGAARLLEAAPDLGAALLERLQPGTMLAEVAAQDDGTATHVAADLLRQLWRPAPEGHRLRPLRSWFGAFDRNREAVHRGATAIPTAEFERADALLAELIATTPQDMVLHGDHHHANILMSRRPGEDAPSWRVIDPKGLAGDPHFDVHQFLFNLEDEQPARIARCVDVFCAELGLDRRRVRQWGRLWGMLQACWSYEDGDTEDVAVNLARAAMMAAI